MSNQVAMRLNRRLTAAAIVIAAHLAALALLFALPRSKLAPAEERAQPLLWIFLAPPSPQPPAKGTVPRGRRSVPFAAASTVPAPPEPALATNPKPDWDKLATAGAIREVEREDADQRRLGALAAPKSPAWTAAPKAKPAFGWSHAATHRLEPLGGGGFLINLTDQCVIVIAGLFLMPACALEKTPARSDLFDHMHDSPALGDWKGR
jgi:hypothetical protein